MLFRSEKANYLPWTFRLPFKREEKKTGEKITHANGISELTKVEFGIPFFDTNNAYILNFEGENSINFKQNSVYNLTLIFDNHKRNKTKIFDTIPLTIKY